MRTLLLLILGLSFGCDSGDSSPAKDAAEPGPKGPAADVADAPPAAIAKDPGELCSQFSELDGADKGRVIGGVIQLDLCPEILFEMREAGSPADWSKFVACADAAKTLIDADRCIPPDARRAAEAREMEREAMEMNMEDHGMGMGDEDMDLSVCNELISMTQDACDREFMSGHDFGCSKGIAAVRQAVEKHGAGISDPRDETAAAKAQKICAEHRAVPQAIDKAMGEMMDDNPVERGPECKKYIEDFGPRCLATLGHHERDAICDQPFSEVMAPLKLADRAAGEKACQAALVGRPPLPKRKRGVLDVMGQAP
jgi:hypothetical protein